MRSPSGPDDLDLHIQTFGLLLHRHRLVRSRWETLTLCFVELPLSAEIDFRRLSVADGLKAPNAKVKMNVASFLMIALSCG